MSALVKIPRSDPPKLEGNFSPEFKDFVSKCLIKDPIKVRSFVFCTQCKQRPSAAALLEHDFIINAAQSVEVLQELVERFY